MIVDILQINQTAGIRVLHKAGQLLAVVVKRPTKKTYQI
jgi:hypothetical protein